MLLEEFYRRSEQTPKEYSRALFTAEELQYPISQGARSVVASVENLDRRWGSRFNAAAGRISLSVDRATREVDNLGFQMDVDARRTVDAVNRLRTNVVSALWQMNSLHERQLDEQLAQTKLQTRMVSQLDQLIHMDRYQNRTRARERYWDGEEHSLLGLYSLAVDDYEQSAKLYKGDYLTQSRLGRLRLRGISAREDVYDLDRAIHHLELAARYGAAYLEHLPEVQWPPGLSEDLSRTYLYLCRAYYYRASELAAQLDIPGEAKHLMLARNSADEAAALSPKMGESHYLSARCSAALNEVGRALKELEVAIGLDRDYALRVLSDREFAAIKSHVERLLETLRTDACSEADILLSQLDHVDSDGAAASELSSRLARAAGLVESSGLREEASSMREEARASLEEARELLVGANRLRAAAIAMRALATMHDAQDARMAAERALGGFVAYQAQVVLTRRSIDVLVEWLETTLAGRAEAERREKARVEELKRVCAQKDEEKRLRAEAEAAHKRKENLGCLIWATVLGFAWGALVCWAILSGAFRMEIVAPALAGGVIGACSFATFMYVFGLSWENRIGGTGASMLVVILTPTLTAIVVAFVISLVSPMAKPVLVGLILGSSPLALFCFGASRGN